MIIFVEGKVRFSGKDYVALDTGGIGVQVFCADPESYPQGEKAFFYTYEQIREDSRTLFGFEDKTAYDLFCSLIEVKGVGCKTALNMLSKMPAEELLRAIENGDVKTLKSLPGIGPRGASQIVLDLKGKVVLPEARPSRKKEEPVYTTNPVWEETQAALIALGYKPAVLEELNDEFDAMKGVNVDTMLRKALQRLARQKGV